MKKTLILALALALVGGVAYANFCARDVVPAASLLVPYAVVDLNADGTPNAAGYSTLFAITNVSSDYQLVHITVWSAQSDAVVDWDVLLTGYDVWTINFRDLLTGKFGTFDTGVDILDPTLGDPWGPSTNRAGIVPNLPDPVDPDPAIAGCNFPYGNRPTLGPIITGKLRSAIIAQTDQYVDDCKSGVPDFASPPWLSGLTDNPVFFYATADVVGACNTAFPNDTGYWTGNGGGRYPIARNVLIGDVIWVNDSTKYSESIPAVHLEASNGAQTAGLYAFYDRYANAAGVEDDREPLGTAFGFRYINNVASTQIIVWQDHLDAEYDDNLTYACHAYAYYAFDENENALARGGGGPSGFDIAEPDVIPFETQSAPLNATNWYGIPADAGWMLLVFDPSIDGDTNSVRQAWVGVRYLSGAYSTSLEAATLANYNCFSNQVLPRLGIDQESGFNNFPTTLPYLP